MAIKNHKRTAVEMNIYLQSVNSTENLRKGIHDDFISPEVLSVIQKNVRLREKFYASESDKIDTICFYTELPVVKVTKSQFRIYYDGTTESTTDFLPCSSLYYNIGEFIIHSDSEIAKIECRKGKLRVSNYSGKILLDEAYPEVNMKGFVDTMKVLLNDRDSRRKIMEIKRNAPFLKKSTPEFEKLRSMGLKGVLKYSTEYNTEMDRVLKQETFIGKNLIERRLYKYGGKSLMCNLFRNKIISENPESIETFTLIVDRNNNLGINYSNETYLQNQVKYNFE
ncbi:hypothetical protein MASR2M117_19010 [Paludibacter sp.]